jgi:hypothetical protein
MPTPQWFEPISFRSITARNRIVAIRRRLPIASGATQA